MTNVHEEVFWANDLLPFEAATDRLMRPPVPQPNSASCRLWFLDCSESCQREIEACLQAIQPYEYLTRERVLILHTRFGLRSKLRNICDIFSEVFCFAELWGRTNEHQELLEYFDAEHLALLPVSPADPKRLEIRSRVGPCSSPNVFISLGRESDLAMARAIIELNPQIHFFCPDRTGGLSAADPGEFRFDFKADNLTLFNSFERGNYESFFDRCDAIFIPLLAANHMRGGVRLADALFARKNIVITQNPLCQALMAQDGKTCLVAPATYDGISASLRRVLSPDHALDEDLVERLRTHMLAENKLAYLLRYVRSFTPQQRLCPKLNFKGHLKRP